MPITIICFDEYGKVTKKTKHTETTKWTPCFDDLTYMTDSICVLSADGVITDFRMSLLFNVEKIYPFGLVNGDQQVGMLSSTIINTNIGPLKIQTTPDDDGKILYCNIQDNINKEEEEDQFPMIITIKLD